MTPITRETLSKLRELCAKATPGERGINTRDHFTRIWTELGPLAEIPAGWMSNAEREANALFIAACSPDVILALVDEVERLRTEVRSRQQ